MNLNIDLERDQHRGRYVAQLPGTLEQAELSYRREAPGKVVAERTFVPESHRGQGVAQLMLERLVADAREDGFAIIPQCPYVRAKAEQHDEWADVVVL